MLAKLVWSRSSSLSRLFSAESWSFSVEHDQEHVGIDGLLDEAERARLHRFDRFRHAPIAGHHDDLRLGARLFEVFEEIDAVRIRKHQIHQHDFRAPRPENLPSLCRIGRRSGQIPAGLYQQFQEISGIPVVVNDQYSGRHFVHSPKLYCIKQLHSVANQYHLGINSGGRTPSCTACAVQEMDANREERGGTAAGSW
jgi:hypothetical protein